MNYLSFICLLLLSQILIYLSTSTNAQPDFLYNFCINDNGNFTNNSIYRSNLDNALASITSNINATIYGFYNTSVGQNSDTVNALALCRGDVDQINCGQCVYDSTLKLRELCPNQKEAIGWYDFCMLRYSNRSILQNREDSPAFYMWNLNNVSDVVQFNEDLRTLLDTIRPQASGGGPLRKFATGSARSSNFVTIYVLVQCTPNLSEENCENCLTSAAREIPTCCGGKQGGRVIRPSCNLRYESDPFFSDTPAGATPPSPAAPNYLYHDCPNTTTYTPNSTYQKNLNHLLTTLPISLNGTVFNTSTSGQTPPNIAYGLFLCRGDQNATVCRECVTTAATEVLTRCPNEKSAVIWYDECMLRYNNNSFFSTVAVSPMIFLVNTGDVTDPTRFSQVFGETMDGLASRASRDNLNDGFVKGFATQEANFTNIQRIYSLAQCTQDLSDEDCDRCLRTAISSFPQCCGGRPGGRVLIPSCNVRYEIYPFYRQLAPASAPAPLLRPPLAPSSVTTPKGSGRGGDKISATTVVAIAAPIAVSVLLFLIGWYSMVRKAKKNYDVVLTDETDVHDIADVQRLQFDLDTIQAVTSNFSDDNKIGEGGFSMVYKGVLDDGQEIAVKRLSKSSGQGVDEFKNEVVLVAKLQHRNLVRLLRFCLEGGEKILIYEYVPNKSLDYILFDLEKQRQLDWLIRYKIIQGIARGLVYLHEDSRLRIIHRDLKASNILLDVEMNAKISDFGMARIFRVDQSQGSTDRIVGTYGYMAPEYAMRGQFSVRSDVFSFGVLVLEIISGKRNSYFYQSDSGEDLLSHAWRMWKNGTPLELVDPSLGDSYTTNEVIRCIHMGLLCVQEDMDARPSMATIVLMLSSYTVSLPVPEQPPLFHSRTVSQVLKGREFDDSTSKSGNCVS